VRSEKKWEERNGQRGAARERERERERMGGREKEKEKSGSKKQWVVKSIGQWSLNLRIADSLQLTMQLRVCSADGYKDGHLTKICGADNVYLFIYL